jgi:hypothetical protein
MEEWIYLQLGDLQAFVTEVTAWMAAAEGVPG